MNPIYLNPSPSFFPIAPIEPSDDEDQHLQFFRPPSQAVAYSLSSSIFSNSSAQEGGGHDRERQEAVNGGPSDHQYFPDDPPPPTVEDDINSGLELSNSKQRENRGGSQGNMGSVRWMSSKMRLMRKMKNSDRVGMDKPVNTNMHKFQQDHHHRSPSPWEMDTSSNSSSNNANNTVRVCSDCNTTKTPLWRSGPRGPKSLCNACGIRQRKARRAMAAANGTLLPTEASSMKNKVHHKEKRSSETGYVQQYKKRCKLATSPRSMKKVCFEDFTINLSKNSSFHRVFPQDEKEAAILLMALSCGLVHG
ncbi:PREDICTED: GATA transcription factor 21-like [Nelumbo nucifera]|uniref:GATA transcription factor 21-like n=1 Tax=Nelumbo nucifera TaxID=4432 RepID=A0A1U7Z4E4_NELNU|nr:PREDICTED: GATA transcription factor 21-like [Nelumbo nucifera]